MTLLIKKLQSTLPAIGSNRKKMSKEEIVKNLAAMFAHAIKGIEDGKFDDAVLIPFNREERLVVVKKANGEETVQVINE